MVRFVGGFGNNGAAIFQSAAAVSARPVSAGGFCWFTFTHHHCTGLALCFQGQKCVSLIVILLFFFIKNVFNDFFFYLKRKKTTKTGLTALQLSVYHNDPSIPFLTANFLQCLTKYAYLSQI